ncbi:hypothetical protein Peur_053936 [Populus x canadensis]
MTGLLLLSSHEGNVTQGNDFFQGFLPSKRYPFPLPHIINGLIELPCFQGIFLNKNRIWPTLHCVSPEIFRRIAVYDCLVNDGRALAPGAALSFRYANTKQYPLPVVSATC